MHLFYTFDLLQVLIFFINQVRSVPDLIKLKETGSDIEQYGTAIFDIDNKNNKRDCAIKSIDGKNYILDSCSVHLDEYTQHMDGIDIEKFNFFLHPFNKRDNPKGNGRVKIHFNGFLSFGSKSQNLANKGDCLRWERSVLQDFFDHPKLNYNFLCPYWMRYFEGSVHIFGMAKDHKNRSVIMDDLREGGLFTDKDETLDGEAQIIVITWLRMASDGTFNSERRVFEKKLMNTFQLYLIFRGRTTYGQFYYRALDTNEIVVETGAAPCYGQVGVARDSVGDQTALGVGLNVGNPPFYGTDNIGYRLNKLPQKVEYYSNERLDNTDIGSWVFRLSPRQNEQEEEKKEGYCINDDDNLKCGYRQSALSCLMLNSCPEIEDANLDGSFRRTRKRRSLTAQELQKRADRFCEFRDEGKFLFPLDCRGYFICDENKRVLFAACSEGQHFHPKRRTCVARSEYPCSSRMPVQEDLKPTDITTVSVDKPMQIIETLHKLWTLNLRIKPKAITYTSDTSAFYAVFDETYETPSILVEKSTTKLKVCGILDNNPKPSITCQTISTPLPLNAFTRVQIQQIPNGEADSKFIVKLNETTKWVGRPKNLKTFNNVEVYPRDPNTPAANVEAKNYKFYSGITSGHVIETLKKLYNTWTLKITLFPLSAKTGDTNILHATRYFDSSASGYLKIDFMAGTTRLRICSPSITLGSTGCVRFFRPFEVNKAVTVEIQRKPASTGYDFNIDVSGSQTFKIKFNDQDSREVNDVNVYVSDYWMPPANSILEAYEFNTTPDRVIIA